MKSTKEAFTKGSFLFPNWCPPLFFHFSLKRIQKKSRAQFASAPVAQLQIQHRYLTSSHQNILRQVLVIFIISLQSISVLFPKDNYLKRAQCDWAEFRESCGRGGGGVVWTRGSGSWLKGEHTQRQLAWAHRNSRILDLLLGSLRGTNLDSLCSDSYVAWSLCGAPSNGIRTYLSLAIELTFGNLFPKLGCLT